MYKAVVRSKSVIKTPPKKSYDNAQSLFYKDLLNITYTKPINKKRDFSMTNSNDSTVSPCEISADTVDHILHLACFDLPEQEKRDMIDELNKMVHWFECLQDVDTNNVEPTFSTAKETHLLRADETQPCPSTDVILKNAPEASMGFFTVPKVVE